MLFDYASICDVRGYMVCLKRRAVGEASPAMIIEPYPSRVSIGTEALGSETLTNADEADKKRAREASPF
jgi:hypothetical protein